MVQTQVTALGWLGSTPEGRRPQIRGWRAGGSLAVASSTPATPPRRPWRSVGPLDKYNVGEVVGPPAISPSKIILAVAERPLFPPLDQALIQAMACEVVAETKEPLSRQSLADLVRRARATLGKKISRSTVWRMLHEA
ncbi:MAG: hypothetical protein ABSH35_23365, partial [Isosphaeraceae bacterium]